MRSSSLITFAITAVACLFTVGQVAASDRITPPGSTHPYAPNATPRQTLNIYPAAESPTSHREADSPTPRPAIIFVHGGAWSMGDKKVANQIAHPFTDAGLHFISVDYRLVPDIAWPDNIRDVAAAVDWVFRHANQWEIDPQRMTLMGHSAGAHLAACVGADPRWLAEHGRTPENLHAVVLLDGAGYDIPAVMASAEAQRLRLYRQAFTDDPAVWRDASPALNVSPNGPACPTWLSIVNANRPSSRAQSQTLFDALTATSQTTATLRPVDKTHMQVLRTLGIDDDPDAQHIIDLATSALAPVR